MPSSYTITARNRSGRTISSVLLGVAIPRGARWASVHAPHGVRCRRTGQVLTCRAPALRPDAVVAIRIVLVSRAPIRVSAEPASLSARR